MSISKDVNNLHVQAGCGRSTQKKITGLSISVYLSICSGLLFIIASILVIIIVNRVMHNEALSVARDKTNMLLQRNLATHHYFSNNLKPKLFNLVAATHSKDYFEPAWMSSTYAIREIDKYFSSFDDYGDYYYKECAINARSPQNEADDFERTFIEELNRNPDLVTRSEIHKFDGQTYYVTLQRGESMEQSCLKCHSTPENAPGDLIARYGPDRSFNRSPGDVVSAVSIRVPLTNAYNATRATSIRLSVILLLILCLMFSSQYFFIKKAILMPLKIIRKKSSDISFDPQRLGENIPVPDGRELGEVVLAFNNMSAKLKDNRNLLELEIQQRTGELRDLNQKLLVEIDERKRTEEAFERSELQLSILNRISEIFLTVSDEDIYGEVLEVVLEAMSSDYGVFGYIDEDGNFVCPSLTRNVWQQCQMSEKEIIYPPETWGGIWGQSMTEKRTLYSNKTFNVPEGHIPMHRALSVPVNHQGEVIGNLLVANKAKDYVKEDCELLEGIAGHIAPILHARLQRDREARSRRKWQEKLQKSRELYSRVVETMSDGILVLDTDFHYIYWNNAMENISGVSRENLVATDKKPWEVFPHLIHTGIDQLMKDAMNGVVSTLENVPYSTPAGTSGYTSEVFMPLKDSEDNVIGILCVVREVSDAVHAEKERQADLIRMEVIDSLSQMGGNSEKAIKNLALEGVIRVTDSEIGYLCLMNEDETVLTLHTWSNEVMVQCELSDHPRARKFKDTGLWGEAVRQRKPVITNDYHLSPYKRGYPEGHLPIKRHMDIPLIVDGKIVLVAGVGNKRDEYTDLDIRQLTLIMYRMWSMLQKKWSEEELKSQQYVLEKAQEIGSIGTWEVDLKKNEIIWTKENYKVFGVPEGTALSYGFFLECVYPYDRDYVETEWAAALNGKLYDIEYRLVVNGSVKWVRGKAELEFDEHGNAVRAIGFTQDIHKRKVAEETLQAIIEGTSKSAGEEFFKVLTKSLASAFGFKYAIVGRVLGSDLKRVKTLAVWSGEDFAENIEYDLEGTPCYNVLDSDMCMHFSGIQSKFPEDTLLADMNVESYIGSSLFDSSGRPIGILILMDTKPLVNEKLVESIMPVFASRAAVELERKIAEDKLRDAYDRFRLFMNNSPSVIFMKDMQGRYFFANDALNELLSLSSEEILGKNDYELLPDSIETADLLRQGDQKVIKQGKAIELEEKLVLDGRDIYYSTVKFPILDSEGRPYAVCGIATDITERKNSQEREKQHQEQLAHASRLSLIGQMASELAHELNQPLCAILAHSEGALRAAKFSDISRLTNKIEKVIKQAERAGSIVSRVKNFAVRDKKLRSSIIINEIITGALELIDPVLRRNRIKVHAAVPDESPAVSADPIQIEQVILNLIQNSIEAMADTPPAKRSIDITVSSVDNGIEIAVKDSGKGIPDEIFANIFEPFYTSKPDGLGVGLAICRSIVEAHGGRLNYRDNTDKGITFYFTIPVNS